MIYFKNKFNKISYSPKLTWKLLIRDDHIRDTCACKLNIGRELILQYLNAHLFLGRKFYQ